MKYRVSWGISALLLSIMLFSCSNVKTTRYVDSVKAFQKRAQAAEKQILAMRKVADNTEAAIESELGSEIKSVEWKGPLRLERGAYISVFVYFEKPFHLGEEQRHSLVDIVQNHFGPDVYWVVAKTAGRVLWCWESDESPILEPEDQVRMRLMGASVKTSLPTDNVDELLGVWTNAEYDTDPGFSKVVWNADRTTSNYRSSHNKNGGGGTFVWGVNDKWKTGDGAIFFKLIGYFNWYGYYFNKRYCYLRLNPERSFYEYVISFKELPSEIDPNHTDYHIYYRK